MVRAKPHTPFEAVRPPARVRLSDSIVSQIEALIVDGTLRPGDALPPEREFARQLGVSRPSLREAILKLEARGLVLLRRGGGYCVADVTGPTLTDPLVRLLQEHPRTAYDILELRRGLEEVAAFLAAQRATDADRKLLKERFAAAVKADVSKGDPLRSAEADLRFHLAVADASHNVALVHVVRGLHNLLRSSVARFRARIFSMQDGSEKLLRQQHRAIYDAVMAGDPEAARQAAHLHLNYVEATLKEADRDEAVPEPASPRAAPVAARARPAKGRQG